MIWSNGDTDNGPYRFGCDAQQKTFVFGGGESSVSRIYVDGSRQFSANDFPAVLNRFGNINEIRNRDYQQAIHEIFDLNNVK